MCCGEIVLLALRFISFAIHLVKCDSSASSVPTKSLLTIPVVHRSIAITTVVEMLRRTTCFCSGALLTAPSDPILHFVNLDQILTRPDIWSGRELCDNPLCLPKPYLVRVLIPLVTKRFVPYFSTRLHTTCILMCWVSYLIFANFVKKLFDFGLLAV